MATLTRCSRFASSRVKGSSFQTHENREECVHARLCTYSTVFRADISKENAHFRFMHARNFKPPCQTLSAMPCWRSVPLSNPRGTGRLVRTSPSLKTLIFLLKNTHPAAERGRRPLSRDTSARTQKRGGQLALPKRTYVSIDSILRAQPPARGFKRVPERRPARNTETQADVGDARSEPPLTQALLLNRGGMGAAEESCAVPSRPLCR